MDIREIVPIFIVGIVFFTAAIIVATVFLFLHRAKELKHQTVRLALEKGLPLPPGLLEESTPARQPQNDLRSGVKAVFIGIGLGLFFWTVEPKLWAIGLIPAFVGLGHVAAWALTGRRQADAPQAQ